MNGEQNVVHLYSGMLFSYEKEGLSNTCYYLDDSRGHYAEAQRDDRCVIPLLEGTLICQSQSLYSTWEVGV